MSLRKLALGLNDMMKASARWNDVVGYGAGVITGVGDKHSETTRRHLPDAAAVYCLLGKLWHAHNDVRKAVDFYVETLKLNPFMWDAFLGLCDTGAYIRTANIFKLTPEMIAILSATSHLDPVALEVLDESPPNIGPLRSQPNSSNSNSNPNFAPISIDPFSIASNLGGEETNPNNGGSGLFRKFNGSVTSNISSNVSMDAVGGFEGMETPTAPDGKFDGDSVMGGSGDITSGTPAEAPHAPLRKMRTIQGLSLDFGMDSAPKVRNVPTKIRSRAGGLSEDSSDPTLIRNSSTLGAVAATTSDRKRTISGQTTQTGSVDTSDPTAAPQRRSVRLFNQIRPTSGKLSSSTSTLGLREGRELKKAKATGTKGRTTTTSTVGRVVSGNRKHIESTEHEFPKDMRSSAAAGGNSQGQPKPAIPEASKERDALQSLLELFIKLGSGYFALKHYQCQDAISIFNSISPQQRETPWVLAQIGRAHYEQASYLEAERVFMKIKKITPSHVKDMEVYSTVLWHLKNEVELAYLSHELIELDRLSPEAWCAMGNSFSLQRDHDQALKCFKRATQLEPKFGYAFTLQGHEHVANEEYDKAQVAYRNGISAEHRHYNAWYGLGKVYEKMGKYEIAEKHFRTAATINPTNAVLVCCIGMVLEKLKNPKAALLHYTKACDLAPRSALSRFKKARVLMTLQEHHMALMELKILKDVAPDEANVHFLLGKLYKTLHQKANSVKHFTTALNLDPKAAAYIKDAMESLEDDDDDNDGAM
ncbi:MAG: anaphase-promoting complex subunit cdc27 [Candelina submexicana]|nr:MAG: anaphase-promoting complex subunit cdc27 [Candelina submexicana]